MGTANVQIKQVLFTSLMLLVFSAVVHSQTCTSQDVANNQLAQVNLKLTLLSMPQTPASCKSAIAIQSQLNTIVSYTSYSSTTPSVSVTQFNSACKAISSVTPAQVATCNNDFGSLIKTTNAAVADFQDALAIISGPNFCNYCCDALYGTSCVNKCPNSCGNGANAASCVAECRAQCKAEDQTCTTIQVMCEQSAQKIEGTADALTKQYNTGVALLQSQIPSNEQFTFAEQHCITSGSSLISSNPSTPQTPPPIVPIQPVRGTNPDGTTSVRSSGYLQASQNTKNGQTGGATASLFGLCNKRKGCLRKVIQIGNIGPWHNKWSWTYASSGYIPLSYYDMVGDGLYLGGYDGFYGFGYVSNPPPNPCSYSVVIGDQVIDPCASGSSQAGGGPADSSVKNGGKCSSSLDCASNNCINGQCVSCGDDSQCQNNYACNSGTCQCRPSGGACTSMLECCSPDGSIGVCKNGVCGGCTEDSDCPTGTSCSSDGSCYLTCTSSNCPSPDKCIDNSCVECQTSSDCSSGEKCTSGGICVQCTQNSDCSSGQACVGGLCVSNSVSCTTQNCPAPNKCYGNSCVQCIQDSDCSSGQICADRACVSSSSSCIAQTCLAPNVCLGGNCVQCVSSGNCPSGEKCTSNECVQCLTSDDCGANQSCQDGSCVETTPSEVVITTQRGVSNQALNSIFNVSNTITEAHSTCVRGAICSSSSDCCGGDCIDSACACSMTACTSSGDCCSGYCDNNGACVSSPSMTLFLTDALNRNLNSQIGCSGIISQCAPDETNCIQVCDGISFLLLVVAGGFGAYSWREFKHPAAGLAAAFAPIMIGFATYPFMGIIIGVILFSLLISKT